MTKKIWICLLFLCLSGTCVSWAQQAAVPDPESVEDEAEPEIGKNLSATDAVEQWIDQNIDPSLRQDGEQGATIVAAPAVVREGYRQELDNGVLDWGSGELAVAAEETTSPVALNPVRERAMAVRRATTRSRKGLLDAVMALRIDGSRTVASELDKRQSQAAEVRGSIQNSKLERQFVPQEDGSELVLVHSRASLRGQLADKLLPPGEPFLSGIPVRVAVTAEDIPAPEVPAETVASRRSMAELKAYTGLVVDARGLEASPALLPLVVAPDGEGAFGPFSVSRSGAVKYGQAVYVGSPANSLVGLRAGKNPLRVKALAASGEGGADLVVSFEDAELIRLVFKVEEIRENCRTVIILDEPVREP